MLFSAAMFACRVTPADATTAAPSAFDIAAMLYAEAFAMLMRKAPRAAAADADAAAYA